VTDRTKDGAMPERIIPEQTGSTRREALLAGPAH
jgi:hypothetical protein